MSTNGLGHRLMSARINAKLTRKELEALSGVSYHTICKVEEGKVARPKNLDALAHALNTSAAWLQFGEGEPHEFADLESSFQKKLKRILSNPSDRAVLECFVNCLFNQRNKGG